MRWASLLVMLALAGCLEGHDPPAAPVAATPAQMPSSTNESTAPAASAAPAPLAPDPSFAANGMGWDGCLARSASLLHKHEWASQVPEEYRQSNAQAGNVGETSVVLLDCQGVSVGNQTFLGPATLGFFGVLVEPPEDRASPYQDYFALDFLAGSAGVAEALESAGLPVQLVGISFGEDGYAVDGDGFALSITEARRDPTPEATTLQARLHWTGAAACWVDLERVVQKEATTEVVLRGTQGDPATVSGPLHVLAGVGSQATESGEFSRPECIGGMA